VKGAPQWVFVVVVILAGSGLGFQAPINAALGRAVGAFEAALVSFGVGAIGAVVVVLLAGRGNLGGMTTVPPWQLVGGILGLLFVTVVIVSVKEIGVSTLLVAALTGQLAAGLLIDHFGWFGVPQRPIELTRVAGVVLLAISVWLINWRR
jgi:bacterial/archaeal transporter family-2 protein